MSTLKELISTNAASMDSIEAAVLRDTHDLHGYLSDLKELIEKKVSDIRRATNAKECHALAEELDDEADRLMEVILDDMHELSAAQLKAEEALQKISSCAKLPTEINCSTCRFNGGAANACLGCVFSWDERAQINYEPIY